MSISKRQKEILDLVNEHTFLTVARLAEATYTSPSSIRRDLTHLQNLSLLKRTHGGASAFHTVGHAVPFNSRMEKNIAEKRKIAARAATLLADGQSVMLEGSTTAGFLVPYIARHKDMTLFTNNMLTAVNAISYGIRTHCIGGVSVDNSAVLSGAQAYRAISEIFPDILLFSSQSLSLNGDISDPIMEENYVRSLMLKNAKYSVFLCDSEKFGGKSLYRLTSLEEIDACVFDREWKELRTKCRIIV